MAPHSAVRIEIVQDSEVAAVLEMVTPPKLPLRIMIGPQPQRGEKHLAGLRELTEGMAFVEASCRDEKIQVVQS